MTNVDCVLATLRNAWYERNAELAGQAAEIAQLQEDLAWAQHEVKRLTELLNAVPAVPVAASVEG